MERVINQEERIRRAEEIYNKRQNYKKNNRTNYYDDNINTKINWRSKIIRKIITQILICLIIYFLFYILQNSSQIFSEKMNSKINEFLSYDIQFEHLYNTYWNNENNKIKNIFSLNEKKEIINEETTKENEENITEEVINEESSINAIGGAEEIIKTESKSQIDLDVEYIKKNINMIWPLNGVITSKFGTREETSIVTANHYGIDIAGNNGDTIIAATDGIVSFTSLSGDYGKHLKILNGEVETLYAHCSNLCVNEGDDIKQGQKIAEVGSTRKIYRTPLTF